MDRVKRTIDLHKNNGLNCSQAILTVFGEKYQLDPDMALILGRPWGAGIGYQGLTCGYLTGAVIAMSLALDHEDEGKSRKDLSRNIRILFNRFQERYGTTMCRELLGADIATEEGRTKIGEEKLVAKHCHSEDGIGRFVAGMLTELI